MKPEGLNMSSNHGQMAPFNEIPAGKIILISYIFMPDNLLWKDIHTKKGLSQKI